MTKFKVRDFHLHRATTDARGNKAIQVYAPGAEVELNDAEAVRYQHLIEPVGRTTTKKGE